MKAIVCTRYGPAQSLEWLDIEAPRPAPDEVLIATRAIGVNFPDTLIIEGRYQFKPTPPFSPGAELCGTIIEVGAQVRGLRVGDRVAATLAWGAYAEQVVAKASQLIRVPERVDDAQAAVLTLAHGTSFHALHDRANLSAGETMLVLGAAGGVGLAAIELGRLMGAVVIAAAGSDERLEICQARGAQHLIKYETEDLRARLREITGERGVDVVYDAVGGRHSEPAFRSLGWNGRHLVVGFAAGDIPRLALNLPLLKGASLVGVFWGDFVRRDPATHAANMNQLMGWLATGRLSPLISHRYALADAAHALLEMKARRIAGKAVLLVPG